MNKNKIIFIWVFLVAAVWVKAQDTIIYTGSAPTLTSNTDAVGGVRHILAAGLLPSQLDSQNIKNYSLSVRDIAQNGAATNDILKWNGSQWVAAPNAAAATYTANNGLLQTGNTFALGDNAAGHSTGAAKFLSNRFLNFNNFNLDGIGALSNIFKFRGDSCSVAFSAGSAARRFSFAANTATASNENAAAFNQSSVTGKNAFGAGVAIVSGELSAGFINSTVSGSKSFAGGDGNNIATNNTSILGRNISTTGLGAHYATGQSMSFSGNGSCYGSGSSNTFTVGNVFFLGNFLRGAANQQFFWGTRDTTFTFNSWIAGVGNTVFSSGQQVGAHALTDLLFAIGNGNSSGSVKSNAITVLKNGQLLVNHNPTGITLTQANCTPVQSAALEVRSVAGGLLPPRITTANKDAIASPVNGIMVQDTTTGWLNVRQQSAWKVVPSYSGSPTEGQVLKSIGGVWVPNDVLANASIQPTHLANISGSGNQGYTAWWNGSSWQYSDLNRTPYTVETTTGTVSASAANRNTVFSYGATQATLTVNLHPGGSPSDGQEVLLTFADQITALTVSSNGSAAVLGAPTTVSAGRSLAFKFYASIGTNGTWMLQHQ